MRCEPLQTFRQTFVTGLQSQPQTAAWRGTKECLMTESTLPDDSTPEPTMLESAKAITRSSYLNVLLVFIPVSWAMHYAKPEEDELIFVFSFLAIIPLAQLLGFATEELSLRVGQTLAGLLNATLGNAVELIVAIIALLRCEMRVVQSSLIGSMLSNILLVLGICFFAGGTRFSEQGFSVGAAQINSSLLIISVVGMLLPAVFYYSISAGTSAQPASVELTAKATSYVLKISHGVALLLLLTYICYIVFQLRTHTHIYDDVDNPYVTPSLKYSQLRSASSSSVDIRYDEVRLVPISPMMSEMPIAAAPEEEVPSINWFATVVLLGAVTALVAVTSEFLVGSIDGLSTKSGLNKEFIGLILIPIVGNAAEHWTAVSVSVKDRLSLSISVAVGSSIQIALFVVPFIVSLGWIIGKPMTLFFDPFESIALFASVLTVNYVTQDGKSNWLEGVILLVLYVIIGTCVFFYPGTEAILTC